MEVTLSMIRDIPIFHLSGRLDALSVPVLEERLKPLLDGTAQRVIFDCSALSYVSSAGLRIFVTLQRHLSQLKGGVAFASLSSFVAEVFAMTGLDALFIIGSTSEEAAAKLLAPVSP